MTKIFNSPPHPISAANKPWFRILAKSADETQVMLYNDIGMWGTSASDFVEQLNGVKSKNITVCINSYGGEVADGFAIYNALKNHDSTVTCRVDGIAASIASVIALAGDKICIARNAFMMIHNPWAMVAGDGDELRKQADILDKMGDQIAKIYSEATGKSIDEVQKAMDEESWFDSDESLAFGLVNEISGDEDDEEGDDLSAAAAAALTRFAKVHPKLRRHAAKLIEKIENQGAGVSDPATPNVKEPAMEKIYARDGKFYIKIDGKEIEVESPMATPQQNQGSQLDAGKIAQDAVEGERKYRAMFTTAMNSAGISGEAAAKFEKDFYGRSEADVKFLASNAIGNRAVAVGEGGAIDEPAPKGDDEAKKIEEAATKRWNSEPRLRKMHGCPSSDPSDPVYAKKMNLFIQAEKKSASDQNRRGKFDNVDDDNDPISKALDNKQIFART